MDPPVRPATAVLTLLLAFTLVVPALALPAEPNTAPASTPRAFEPSPLYHQAALAADACRTAACRAAAVERIADGLRAELAALPYGAAATHAATLLALRHSGFGTDTLPVDASPSLGDALVGMYKTLGITVDAGEVHDAAHALAAEHAAALTPLIDAIRAAHGETRRILGPDAAAALASDLATTMKLVSLVGSAPPGTTPRAWQDLWQERAALLAAADLDAMGRAAATLTLAVGTYLGQAPAPVGTSCEPSLDLPLVRIAGTCDDTHPAGTLYVLLIDEGGDDTYLGGVGAGLGSGPGIGIGLDRGNGADTYSAPTAAQGFGLGGVGILVDEGGSDAYRVTTFGHGMGVAGFGLLHDMGSDDDTYTSPDPDDGDPIGTKAAGLAGVGLLIDEGGDDAYEQAGLDGFVYGAAGGSGWMIERGGNDTYRSDEIPIALLGELLGTFAGPIQVSGEVGGTTVLYEAGGADTYFCGPHVRQGCQGAAGAGSITLLLEEAGSDVYTMGESFSAELVPGVVIFPMGQGAGYGPSAPAGIALLRDADGDDTYAAEKWAQGYGTVGLGFLLDLAGTDTYSVGAPLIGTRGDGQAWADGTGGIGRDA